MKTGYAMSSTSIELIRKLLSVALIFVFNYSSHGQVLQPDRFEIAVNRDEPSYEVINARQNGMFLCRKLQTNLGNAVELIRLDTALQKKWQGYIAVDQQFDLASKRTDDKYLYLLYRNPDIKKKDFLLHVVDQDSGSYSAYTIKNFIPLVVTDFQIAKKGVLIGGYYNFIPVVVYFSLKTSTSKILPGLSNEPGDLTQIKVNDEGSFDVLISTKQFNRQKTIWIKSYDEDGGLVMQTPLLGEDSKSLMFARSIKSFNDLQFIAGTYGTKNSEYTRGIFISTIGSNGNQQIKYYNYGDLSNFFKYLRVRREARIKERIERRKIKGKKVRFNYRFIVHEIVPYNDQFILLGEAFYPKYITTDPRYGGGFFYAYSNPFSIYNGRIFDGFRYTHAVVMGFDKNGRLLWDNSFEINDVKTYTLEQFVKLEIHDDRIVLLYLYDNKIRSKIIRGNTVLEGKTVEPIRTNNNQDVAKESNTTSKLDYWYGDYFFASGVQNLLNYKAGERRVFYINKVTYADAANGMPKAE